MGLTPVTWDIDTQDWNGASSSAILASANGAQNGSVFLMHDGYTTTNQDIPTMVTSLKNRGFQAGSINSNGDAVAWSGGSSGGTSSNSASSASSGNKTIVVRARGVTGAESLNL